jgi:hypothetical protein
VREAISLFLTRASEERWLILFLVFHVVGVHWLAGAKAWWMKWPAALCLLAAAPCWVKAVHLSPSMLGFNAPTAAAGSSLLLLAGLWLFLAGRGPAEWLSGFAAAVLGGAAVLFLIGHRWPAVACASLLIPLIYARSWFVNSEVSSDTLVARGIERWISTLATGAFAVVLALSNSSSSRSSNLDAESIERLRDFVTQPAILLLLLVSGVFTAAATIHLWPTAETP